MRTMPFAFFCAKIKKMSGVWTINSLFAVVGVFTNIENIKLKIIETCLPQIGFVVENTSKGGRFSRFVLFAGNTLWQVIHHYIFPFNYIRHLSTSYCRF